MMKADFPRRRQNRLSKEQTARNEALAEKYNRQGYFPYVVVFSPDGQVAGSMGFEDISPKQYADRLNKL